MGPDLCMADSHSGTDASVGGAAYQHVSNVDGSMDESTLTERPGVGFATCECISSHDIDPISMVDSMLTVRPTSLHEPSWNPLSLSHKSTHPAQFFDHPAFEIRLATHQHTLFPRCLSAKTRGIHLYNPQRHYSPKLVPRPPPLPHPRYIAI